MYTSNNNKNCQLNKKKIDLSHTYCKKIIVYLYFIALKKYKLRFIALNLIKNKILCYLIYTIYKPEWEAKYERLYYIRLQQNYIAVIINYVLQKYNISRNFSTVQVKPVLAWKHFRIEYFSNKISNNSIIKQQLNLWFCGKNFISLHQVFEDFFKQIENDDTLYLLFINLLYIGLEWYIYINLKYKRIYQQLILSYQTGCLFFIMQITDNYKIIQCLSHFFYEINTNLKNIYCVMHKYINKNINLLCLDLNIKKNNYSIIKLNKIHTQRIINNIRCKLYHKNKKNYWKINNSLQLLPTLLYIKFILRSYFYYYFNLLNKKEISRISNTIDKIFYLWQTKK